jgi:D-alanyl-D-alanine dipeptidase
MKMRPDALATVENESERAKHENGSGVHITAENESGAQNMKFGPNALGTDEMGSSAQNMKMGPDTLDTAENQTGRAILEDRTRRPRYR